jgi:hypothetical protein
MIKDPRKQNNYTKRFIDIIRDLFVLLKTIESNRRTIENYIRSLDVEKINTIDIGGYVVTVEMIKQKITDLQILYAELKNETIQSREKDSTLEHLKKTMEVMSIYEKDMYTYAYVIEHIKGVFESIMGISLEGRETISSIPRGYQMPKKYSKKI